MWSGASPSVAALDLACVTSLGGASAFSTSAAGTFSSGGFFDVPFLDVALPVVAFLDVCGTPLISDGATRDSFALLAVDLEVRATVFGVGFGTLPCAARGRSIFCVALTGGAGDRGAFFAFGGSTNRTTGRSAGGSLVSLATEGAALGVRLRVVAPATGDTVIAVSSIRAFER
jgi:hypothetical protein